VGEKILKLIINCQFLSFGFPCKKYAAGKLCFLQISSLAAALGLQRCLCTSIHPHHPGTGHVLHYSLGINRVGSRREIQPGELPELQFKVKPSS